MEIITTVIIAALYSNIQSCHLRIKSWSILYAIVAGYSITATDVVMIVIVVVRLTTKNKLL